MQFHFIFRGVYGLFNYGAIVSFCLYHRESVDYKILVLIMYLKMKENCKQKSMLQHIKNVQCQRVMEKLSLQTVF